MRWPRRCPTRKCSSRRATRASSPRTCRSTRTSRRRSCAAAIQAPRPARRGRSRPASGSARSRPTPHPATRPASSRSWTRTTARSPPPTPPRRWAASRPPPRPTRASRCPPWRRGTSRRRSPPLARCARSTRPDWRPVTARWWRRPPRPWTARSRAGPEHGAPRARPRAGGRRRRRDRRRRGPRGRDAGARGGRPGRALPVALQPRRGPRRPDPRRRGAIDARAGDGAAPRRDRPVGRRRDHRRRAGAARLRAQVSRPLRRDRGCAGARGRRARGGGRGRRRRAGVGARRGRAGGRRRDPRGPRAAQRRARLRRPRSERRLRPRRRPRRLLPPARRRGGDGPRRILAEPSVNPGHAGLPRGVRLLHLLPGGPPQLEPVEALARLRDLDLVELAPVEQRRERREQRLARVGQLVLDPGWNARIDVAQDQAVALELAQRGREHAARDAVDLAQELVEPVCPARQPREDGEAPLGAEDAERALQGVEARFVREPGATGTGRCGTRLHSGQQSATFSRKLGTLRLSLNDGSIVARTPQRQALAAARGDPCQDAAMLERPVLVAPDSFKGTFRAAEVAGAIGRGLERAGLMPPDLCPLADGGEGTMDALLIALGGETAAVEVRGPLGTPVQAQFGLVEDGGTAVLEMASASGLGLVPEDERDAWAASTYGTGELICAAVDAGAEVVLVGVGGSATTDGGAGAIEAIDAHGG